MHNANQQDQLLFSKVPPQAVELEEALLGSMMSSKDSLNEVIPILSEDVFYKESNRVIYRAIVDLFNENSPVDILSVTERLRKTGDIDMAGGMFYLTTLTDHVVFSNTEYYARIIQQKYIQREIIRISSESIKEAYEETADAFDCIKNADDGIQKLLEVTTTGSQMTRLHDILSLSCVDLKRREEMFKMGKINGVTTGFKELDRLLGGFQNGELIIIGGRPGMGKTALMLKMARAAAESGKAPCIYSLEMSKISLGNRMLLSMTDVDADAFRAGNLTSNDWAQINRATERSQKLKMHIDDNPVVNMRYIRAHSRLMKKKWMCDIIFLDYLQLTDMDSGNKNTNREREVAATSRAAKIIAKELNVPVVLLSQLSRYVERSSNKKPTLSDLRESGAIEQDADVVMFTFRPAYYEDLRDESTIGKLMLLVEKNRNGGLKDIILNHNESLTKIYDDYEREQQPTQEDMPF